jgi:hypothetical protein
VDKYPPILQFVPFCNFENDLTICDGSGGFCTGWQYTRIPANRICAAPPHLQRRANAALATATWPVAADAAPPMCSPPPCQLLEYRKNANGNRHATANAIAPPRRLPIMALRA